MYFTRTQENFQAHAACMKSAHIMTSDAPDITIDVTHSITSSLDLNITRRQIDILIIY